MLDATRVRRAMELQRLACNGAFGERTLFDCAKIFESKPTAQCAVLGHSEQRSLPSSVPSPVHALRT